MDENILAEVLREGEEEATPNSVEKEPQAEPEKDTPAESPTESDEDIRRNEAWKELREERDREREARETLEARLEALERERIEIEPSDFVTSLVGDNEEVNKQWQKERERLKIEMRQELEEEQRSQAKRARDEQERWAKWTEDRLAEVEKEFGVDFKKDESKKNELSKIMLDYSPTDTEGNLDYRKGMKILTELSKVRDGEKTQQTQAKKDIADATISKETATETTKGFLTANDLRGKDWRSLIH